MKYEKYLKQIAEKAASHLFWVGEYARQADEVRHGDTIFSMVAFAHGCIFHIQSYAKNHEWMEQALAVPRKFVEESRRTTALAVLNEWNKENGKV